MRAIRNKTEYVNLTSIIPSADDKRVVFSFENNTSFSWCVFDFKFYHGDTGAEFGESHFKNIVWGMDEDRYGGLTLPIKPGHERFFNFLDSKSKEGWVKNFFKILSKWINERVENQRRNGAFKLYQRKMNKLETLCRAEVIAPVESLAKNNFVNQMNLDRVCKSVFRGDKIVSFKEMREDNLDAWFFQHVSERAHPQYLREDNPYNQNADVYAGDENREFILGNYMENYRTFNRGGMGDLFRHLWENYKFAFSIQEYYFNRFKETMGRLATYGYDQKRLMDYLFRDLPNQGLSQHMGKSHLEGLDILSDYARMSIEMDREFDKYPRYLKTAHDIAAKNYKVNKSKVLSGKYESVKESLKKMEYKAEKFSVLVPESLESIVKEGSSLNHCVASYIEGVVNGEYAILFLRSNEELEKSLVTVQVKDGRVLQARGQSNRPTTEEEAKFLEKFVESLNKQKEMVLEEAA